VARGVIAWILVVVAVAAGVGWLYVLRGLDVLSHGPGLPDALPLQQLSAHSSQPLLRVAVAWIPAGILAGLVLAWVGRIRLVPRTLGLAVLAELVLLSNATISGALAQNDNVTAHLGPALRHSGVWGASVCIVIGSLLVAPAARPARRDRAKAATAA
jgi:hypothetical protein